METNLADVAPERKTTITRERPDQPGRSGKRSDSTELGHEDNNGGHC